MGLCQHNIQNRIQRLEVFAYSINYVYNTIFCSVGSDIAKCMHRLQLRHRLRTKAKIFTVFFSIIFRKIGVEAGEIGSGQWETKKSIAFLELCDVWGSHQLPQQAVSFASSSCANKATILHNFYREKWHFSYNNWHCWVCLHHANSATINNNNNNESTTKEWIFRKQKLCI